MVDYSDETQLLSEIKKGDNQAFEFLFKTYYPRLRGYAIRFVEDDETARDIIQECFMRFWEKRELLTAVSVTSLLFAMVRNGCLNYLKHLSIVEKHQIEYLAKKGCITRISLLMPNISSCMLNFRNRSISLSDNCPNVPARSSS